MLAHASLLVPESAASCLSGVPEALTCLTHLGVQNPDLLCPSSPFFPSPRGTLFLQLLSLTYLRNFIVVVAL